uniref:F-box domain-containing protein n=1 Tax=Oryza barthii TaxID=65489 RepID=A0A0D3GX65_9ORYZ
MGAGQVCRAWRRAARDEPELWRRIDMLNHAELSFELNLFGMAQAAVRRSEGQCEAFWGEYAADEDLLHFLGDRAPCLKSLRLMSCFDILDEGFSAAVKKFPLLEELELTLCDNLGENDVFKAVGKACPQLKRFRLSKRCFYNYKHSGYNKDEQALGIATMHELRSLQLFANNLSNEGLTAILDNCLFLESLDIRHCFNVSMDDTLRAKCARIKTLRLPYDSTDDYDFQVHKPIWSGADFFSDSDDDCVYGGPDYILDSDEYDDYCDPYRYLDGVYEDELDEEDRMMLKAMRIHPGKPDYPRSELPDILRVRELRHAPHAAALQNPIPHKPQPHPTIPSSSTTTTTSGRRRSRRGRGRKEGDARDWAGGLPLDAILAIFHKLDHIEILMGAGQVCRSWRRAARDEPQLWRRIDMRGHADLSFELNLFGMAQAAVRRSAGQCEAFWGEYAADEKLLHFLGERAPSVKSLRLISCYDILNEGFSAAIKKFPLLEELELSLCSNIGESNVFEVVGKACPQLKRFRFSKDCFYSFEDSEYEMDE